MPQLKQHQRAAARDARAAAAAAAAASEVPIEGKGKGKVATATEVLNEGKGKGKIATAPEVLNKGKGKGKIAAATEVLNEGKGKGKVAAAPEVLNEGKGKGKVAAAPEVLNEGKGKGKVAAAPEVLNEVKGKGKGKIATAPEVLIEDKGKGKSKSTVAAAPEVLNESKGKGKGKGKVAAAFEVPSAPEVWSEVLRLQRELGTAIARVEQLSLLSSSSTSGSIDPVIHPPPEPVVVRERQRLPEYASFRPLSAWPDYQDEVKCDFGDCNDSRPCTRAPVGWIKLTNKYKGICAERLHKKVEEEEQALLWANTPSPPKVCRWADGCDSLKHNIVVDPDDLIKTKTGAWQCYECRYSY